MTFLRLPDLRLPCRLMGGKQKQLTELDAKKLFFPTRPNDTEQNVFSLIFPISLNFQINSGLGLF